MTVSLSFYWYDYIIFFAMLLTSVLIGIYFGCFGTRQSTTSEYIMGNRKLGVLPVAVSVAVSHFSGVTLVGVPADVYKFGATYWLTCFSMVLLVLISVCVYMPVFFKLNLTSVYEYLERRFDKKTKLLASFMYVLADILFCPLLIYSPSLALSAATGVDVNLVSFTMCACCVFYTAIGGLKAVIWTDFFQLAVIMITLIIIYIMGFQTQKNFLSVWNTAIEGQRLDIFDFSLDPTKRDTFWILIIGFTTHWLNYISLTQTAVQKFLTLRTFRECVWSVVYFAVTMMVVTTLCVFIGFLMYDKYKDCDPLLSKQIWKHDQIVPYYVMDLAEYVPGISGLFMATLVSGGFSSFSCSLNAISGVIYKDFVRPRNISETTSTNILKLIVLISGLACIGLILIMKHLGEIVPLGISLTGMAAGPSMGMFTLGVLFPKANAKGAFYGAIGGFIFIANIVIPAKYYQYQQLFNYPSKPLSTNGCNNASFVNATMPTTNSSVNLPPSIFRISYYYHLFIGAFVTLFLGLLISYFTNKKDPPVDQILISPVAHFLMPKETNRNAEVMDNLMEN